MIEAVLKDVDTRMQKTLNALVAELATIRTGRASSALVEHIKADYHGIATPINQMASISTPEAKMILIQPWDKSALKNIEKAILKSDIGLNPTNDGNVIRIIIPAVNEERRKELIKVIHKRLEESKVSLRNLRRDGMEELRKAEKNKEISQDDLNRATEKLQKLIDSYVDKVDHTGKSKEAEIMEV
ncbi:MAG TPA: ribosome recycling factor [Dehalococcoidia bacterium]|nr:ribosome recycling factor [Dehalococcoidia bacterium]